MENDPATSTQPGDDQTPFNGNLDYCKRLLGLYKSMPADQLVSHPTLDEADSGPAGTNGLAAPALDRLQSNPRLQVKLAAATAYTPSKWLLEQELSLRKNKPGDPPSWAEVEKSPIGPNANLAALKLIGYDSPPKPAPCEEVIKAAQGQVKLKLEESIAAPKDVSWAPETVDVFDAAACQNLSGLCFSGGGIRSATFNLGVLQALAKKGKNGEEPKLSRFDYLSTVSGGGYIHQWFASWILREPLGFARVQDRLTPLPDSGSPARAPEEISWLRRYSNYLTPQKGVLSADTWTMAAIWFRNTFLNQIVLFTFLGLCLLAGRGATYFLLSGIPHFMKDDPQAQPPHWLPRVLDIATAVLCILLWRALYYVTQPPSQKRFVPPGSLNDRGVAILLVIPGFLFALLLSMYGGGTAYPSLHPKFFGHLVNFSGLPVIFDCWGLYVLGLLLAITFGGRSLEDFVELKAFRPWGAGAVIAGFFFAIAVAIAAVGCAALSVYLVHAAGAQLLPGPHFFLDRVAYADLVSVGLPVLFFFFQFIAIRLQVGVLGRFYAESRREWLARYGGWSAIVSIVWIALCGIARLGPPFYNWSIQATHHKQLAGVSLSVILTHVATLFAGSSSKSDGNPKSNTFFGYSALDLLGMIGAPLCIFSLLVIVSTVIEAILSNLRPLPSAQPYWFFLIVLATFLFFGWRVDVNEFSMQGFYRNRLARGYLGATARNRKPDLFTGFDDHDTSNNGIALSDLLPKAFHSPVDGEAPQRYDGPFPIFCTTLNLSYGEDLGAQERKGASFAFTPLFSGYHVGWTGETGTKGDTTYVGYVRTDKYAYRTKGISLANVTAISGAAISPNMGYNSQPALAFLMTLFNARLGWWLANPRRPGVWPSKFNSPTPVYGLRYLLRELFGLSDDTSNYICLSDGGHFENMGLYELVRRRCKLIVICDAEGDSTTVFEGIGLAISKCRTDFGAEITLDLNPMIPATEGKNAGKATQHFQIGTIQYPPPPGSKFADKPEAFLGKVIYLKTSITGNETADILHYRRAFPSFPQDTTLNQWFTETQFESYRRLGQLIGEEVAPYI